MNDKQYPRRRLTSAAAAWATALVLLGGCASIPDISVSYRPVRWSVLVVVAHTITCTRDSQLAVVDRGATFVPVYSAADADPRFQIRLKDLDRFYADADLTLAFTDDGRLKSINQSTTGQGESVVKAAIGAVAAVSATSIAAAATPPDGGIQLFSNNRFEKKADKAQPSDVCKVIREWSLTAPNQLPQVSLVQFVSLKGPTAIDGEAAEPSHDQAPLFNKLKANGLDLSTRVVATLPSGGLQPIAKPRSEVASDEVPLTLQQLGTFRAKAWDMQGDIGSRSIPVPLPETFVLPIPKAALFGKQSFSLVLAESGRVTSIGYGRTTGVPGALGAITALAGAETTEDTAEAAALKAASDLIAQQQRNNTCRLKPAECK